MFDLNDSTGYDDNVFGANQNTHGDWFTDVGARASFFTARKHADVSLDYAPSFFIYKQYSSANFLNQALSFNASIDLSRRFQLKVRDDASEYSYGSFGNVSQLVPGLGPPGGAILYSIIPGRRTVTNQGRVDLFFTKSRRTTIDVFGTYNTLTYQGGFHNLQEAVGGVSYAYRVTRRGTFSATYDYSDSLFQASGPGIGALSTQGGSRFTTQSAMLSYAYQLLKTTSVSFFAGPERTQAGEILVETIPLPTLGYAELLIPIHRFEWDWSAGGSVATTTHDTAINFTASRAVSNGGGLLTDVTSNYASLGIARRLPHGWRVSSSLSGGFSQALVFGSLPGGNFNTEIGQASLHRELGEHLGVDLDYEHQRQRVGGGNSLGVANMDRDRASVRFDWVAAKIPFGHHRL
jgi:hypothetical protein